MLVCVEEEEVVDGHGLSSKASVALGEVVWEVLVVAVE